MRGLMNIFSFERKFEPQDREVQTLRNLQCCNLGRLSLMLTLTYPNVMHFLPRETVYQPLITHTLLTSQFIPHWALLFFCCHFLDMENYCCGLFLVVVVLNTQCYTCRLVVKLLHFPSLFVSMVTACVRYIYICQKYFSALTLFA